MWGYRGKYTCWVPVEPASIVRNVESDISIMIPIISITLSILAITTPAITVLLLALAAAGSALTPCLQLEVNPATVLITLILIASPHLSYSLDSLKGGCIGD